ncbi:MAG: 4-hydroxyphenylpyruvate dioxygenase [Pseudomonadota bacterium]|jgi:4-hydroxyphenylpyruvate dioxygenase
MNTTHREGIAEGPNRLGLAGIEFIEYVTQRPQALGRVLENMGFQPVARHRSREVVLYRQGDMNLVVNANADDARLASDQPVLSAVAFRVHDARSVHERCLQLGAWGVERRVQAMELHIPAIHGPGRSRFYFVDRWQEFSIFDIDFKPIPGAALRPPALAGMDYFGVVQYVGMGRSVEWMAYFEHMFDFVPMADSERFGIMPKGHLMRSPGGHFLWQLVEPDPGLEPDWGETQTECLQRIGLGVSDVAQAVEALKKRGVEFVDSGRLHPEDRGALTRNQLGSVAFELVQRQAGR